MAHMALKTVAKLTGTYTTKFRNINGDIAINIMEKRIKRRVNTNKLDNTNEMNKFPET